MYVCGERGLPYSSPLPLVPVYSVHGSCEVNNPKYPPAANLIDLCMYPWFYILARLSIREECVWNEEYIQMEMEVAGLGSRRHRWAGIHLPLSFFLSCCQRIPDALTHTTSYLDFLLDLSPKSISISSIALHQTNVGHASRSPSVRLPSGTVCESGSTHNQVTWQTTRLMMLAR